MRRVLCGVACVVLAVQVGPANAVPGIDAMRVIIHATTVSGVLEGECVAASVPTSDPATRAYVLVAEGETSYRPPSVFQMDCYLKDGRDSALYGRSGAPTVLVAGAEAEVVMVPAGILPLLCLELAAGPRHEVRCVPPVLIQTGGEPGAVNRDGRAR
jgi:hypothetical protein